MTTTIQESTSTEDRVEAEREILRQCLEEIADELGQELRDVNLDYPIYLTIPNSRNALVLMATALDPSSDDWDKIAKITQKIVSRKLGRVTLRNRHMMCATTSAVMSAVDLSIECHK